MSDPSQTNYLKILGLRDLQESRCKESITGKSQDLQRDQGAGVQEE